MLAEDTRGFYFLAQGISLGYPQGMTTHFIGLKELRGSLTKVATEAKNKNRRYIVLRKNLPIFELRPLSQKDATLERLQHDLDLAEKDVRAGKFYTQEEVEKMLHL